jgi:hypothetical protein
LNYAKKVTKLPPLTELIFFLSSIRNLVAFFILDRVVQVPGVPRELPQDQPGRLRRRLWFRAGERRDPPPLADSGTALSATHLPSGGQPPPSPLTGIKSHATSLGSDYVNYIT